MKALKYAAVALALVAMFAMIPMDEGDAASSQIAVVEYPEDPFFDTMNGGSLTFILSNSGASDVDVTAKVTIKETGKVLKEVTQTVPGSINEYEYYIGMGGYKSEGEHQINVTFTETDKGTLIESFDMIIDVEENILSNWTTFVVIIVVVIIIAIIVFMKMRDNQSKKTANTMTFEELEAQRKAEMAAKSEKKEKAPKAPASTERRRYKK